MIELIEKAHRALFLKRKFYSLHKFLFHLSARGLGILNFENDRLSGENNFLHSFVNIANKMPFVVIDVGANIGKYSNQIKILSPDVEIYAFEPHPKTFVQLQSSAALHGYTALNSACGDIPGNLKLYDYAGSQDGSQHASLYEDVIEKIHKSSSTFSDVQVIMLDNFIKERKINRIHLLKIDTEGNEMKVLMGAKEAISKRIIDIIHFEFNEMNVVSRVFFKDFYDFLDEYIFYRMLPDGLVPLERYNPLLSEIFAYQNIIAIRKDVTWFKIP
jgi:FkbM family methyltransferase